MARCETAGLEAVGHQPAVSFRRAICALIHEKDSDPWEGKRYVANVVFVRPIPKADGRVRIYWGGPTPSCVVPLV